MLKAVPSRQQQVVIDDIDKGVRKLSIRSGHGTGKTTLLAWIVIWWGLFKDDAKIPMTAPTAPQLHDLLIPEIKKWRENLPLQLKNEITVLMKRVDFKNNNFAVARTARADQPEALQGFHATSLAFVIDEASGIPQIIFEVAEGAMTGEDTLVIMTANPTRVDGYFYDSHHKNKWQWSTYQFNAEESENVAKSWLAEKERQYGKDSDVYRVRVQGEFPRQSSDAVFTLQEVEGAITNEIFDDSGAEVWGLDVADFGDDKSILVKRKGKDFHTILEKSNLDLSALAGWLIHQYKRAIRKPVVIFVDAIGIGSGLASICYDRGLDIVVGVKASNRADDDERFFNKRTEWYFLLKEALPDARLPDDDDLLGELMAQRYFISPSGKEQLVSKKEIKKELGRSPDKADACVLSMNVMIYDDGDNDEYSSETVDDIIPCGANGGAW